METLRVCVCGVSSRPSFPITPSPGAEAGLSCLSSREGIRLTLRSPLHLYTYPVFDFSIQIDGTYETEVKLLCGFEMVPFVTLTSM